MGGAQAAEVLATVKQDMEDVTFCALAMSLLARNPPFYIHSRRFVFSLD